VVVAVVVLALMVERALRVLVELEAVATEVTLIRGKPVLQTQVGAVVVATKTLQLAQQEVLA
jgi:hypothetical protein